LGVGLVGRIPYLLDVACQIADDEVKLRYTNFESHEPRTMDKEKLSVLQNIVKEMSFNHACN
jgi:hypothetical protein